MGKNCHALLCKCCTFIFQNTICNIYRTHRQWYQPLNVSFKFALATSWTLTLWHIYYRKHPLLHAVLPQLDCKVVPKLIQQWATSESIYFCSQMEELYLVSWATLTHVSPHLSAGSVGMSVRSAVNAVLTELVRSLSRALAAFLWRPSGWGEDIGGPSLPDMVPTSTPPIPEHSFLFLFTLMWKADGEEEDRRKAAELDELLVRSSEPEPSLPFSSSSSERRAMSPYKKRPAGGAVRSMANVIFTANRLWQLLVRPCGTSTCKGSACDVF